MLLSKATYIPFQGTHFTILSSVLVFPGKSNPCPWHCKRQCSTVLSYRKVW